MFYRQGVSGDLPPPPPIAGSVLFTFSDYKDVGFFVLWHHLN